MISALTEGLCEPSPDPLIVSAGLLPFTLTAEL